MSVRACRGAAGRLGTGTTGTNHDRPGRRQLEVTATDSANLQRDGLRSDAQLNRQRILAAAHEALTASADASLNSIAKKAGVGPGTLYRHFPSREALVLAVYQADVQTLADFATELLTTHQPVQALRMWLDRVAAYGTANHSLAAALQSATSDGLTGATYDPVVAALRILLSACRQDDGILTDIDADDVLLLIGFLWRIDSGPDSAAQMTRLLDLVMTGLTAGAPRAQAVRASRRSARRSLRLPRRLSLPVNRPRSHPL